MFDFLSKLFDTSDFRSRWHCGNWTAGHGWLHIVSDLGVWSAYVAIPCVLGYFVLRRKDIPFRTIFLLFGAFILACGTTHLMEALMFWWPAYRLAGVIKLLTAVVSWGTVLALVPVTPRALAMPSPEELEREIIARKHAESALEQANAELQRQIEALTASEERFRLLVEGTKDHAIFMLDPSGRIASWNPGAERIKKYRTEEIVGQHFSRFYSAEDVQAGKPEKELQVAAAEGRYEEEGWRLRKDGSRFWANVVITALRDDGGKLRGFSKITRDVTERKQAEENARRLLEEAAARRAAEEQAAAIQAERERLRVTLHSIGDGVIAADAEGRVTLLNPVAEALTGWKSAEATGQPLQNVFRIINEQTRQVVENPVAKVLREGTVVGLANHTVLISKEEGERPIDDSAAPIKDTHGRLVGVVLVFRDATDQRARESRRAARLTVAQTLAEVDSIQEAAPPILRALGENLGWKVGGLWLPDPERQKMRCLDLWHSPSFAGEGFQSACRQFSFKAGEGLPGRVWESGQPMWITDLAEDDHFPRASFATQEGMHAAFAFPIVAGSQVLGTIELFGMDVRQPDPDLMEMGSSMGAMIGEFMERRSAEERLRNEREWFRTTLASIGDGVITTDTEGKVTFLNPVSEALTGWPQEEARGKPLAAVFTILHEQSRQPVANPVVQALREGRIVGLGNHTLLIARDGTERPIDDSAAPIKNDRGQTAGVVLVFRDVTERRRAERAVRRNREILQLVHQIGKIGHWEWNSLTDENRWSPEIEALYGLPPGGFEGGYQGWAKLLHPDDLPRAEADVRRALETGKYFTEFRVIWPDGTVHWLETRAVVFKDGHDKPVRIVGVNMDITERKRQEEALRASEQRWRTMAESLPNLVWTALPDGQCDWLSSQWGKYTGIAETELLGLRWLETVIHPDDRERTLAFWTAACADQGDYDLEYWIRRYDGEYHWFKTRGLPIRDEQGKIVYWFGTCTDIEDVKRLEAALREADRRKNEFLATLAHELRNPLAPIRNGLQVLRLANERSAQEQARAMMERQLGQLVRLVDDLLDVSRISRNKLELRKARIPLASVVENAVETARPLIDAKGHTLSVTLPPEPLYLDADLTRLAQVFWNLLNNSAKYTDPGGRIDLVAERQGSVVVVTVRDSGIGIPREALPGLFTLFSQVDPSLERSQGGLGIGLALIKGLVERHGGSVEAHSGGVGQGSLFVVRLPVAPDQGKEEKPGTDDNQVGSALRRVLVVDDNRDAAASLAMMLSLVGHDTRTAHDGLEALELAEAFRPDVILLDIGLPKLNGYDTCRRIREQPWGTEMFIVAVTGWGQEDARRRSQEAGFDHHLVKPVDFAALEKLLARLKSVAQ
jgi:PAS domain S-box-containing protein